MLEEAANVSGNKYGDSGNGRGGSENKMNMFVKEHKKAVTVWIGLMIIFLIASFLTGSAGGHESLRNAMRDAVLHEENRISLFGIMNVNPSVISAYIVTAVMLIAAAIIRIFVIPKFTIVPGKTQIVIETMVDYFRGLAEKSSPHRNKVLGAYVFAAGVYICISTLFELFGFQAVCTNGTSIALPAPFSDINGAIAMGVMSYFFIMSGGIAGNGLKGVGLTLKEISLLLSLSFRLFGALLSGLLVTELVYHTIYLSIVFPVLVGIMFTLMHALIQAYVLTMLVSIFYGEVSEPPVAK